MSADAATGPYLLKTLRVSFPVVRYEVLVRYTVPRRATVFEEAVLRLVDMAARHEDVAALPVERVVTDLLGVPDPDGVFLPVVRSLFNSGLIRVSGSLQSLKLLQLRQIQFTERGRHMFERGEMPSVDEEHRDECYFDPIKGRLLRRCHATDDRGPVAIELDDAKLGFPEAQYRELLRKSRPGWLPQGARIVEARPEHTQRRWLHEQAEVHIEKGELLVKLRDADRFRYVQSLSPKKVQALILTNSSDASSLPAPPDTVQVDLRAEWPKYAGLTWQFWGDAYEVLLNQDCVVVFSEEFCSMLAEGGGRWRVLIEAGSGCAVPRVQARGSQDSSRWIVHVRDGVPPGRWAAATRDGALYVLDATVRLGAGVENVLLAAWDRRDGTREQIADLMCRIAAELLGGAVRGAAVAAFWLPAPEFWRCVREVSKRRPRLADRLALLRRLCSELEQHGFRKHLASAGEALLGLVRSYQGTIDRTDLKAVVDTAQAVQRHAVGVVEPLIELLCERVPRDSMQDWAAFRERIRSLDPQWVAPYSAKFYSYGLLQDICHHLFETQAKLLDYNSPFERRLVEWRTLCNRVSTALGGWQLHRPASETDLLRRARRCRDPEVRDKIRSALRYWNRLANDYPQLAKAAIGTPVATAVQNLAAVAELVDQA